MLVLLFPDGACRQLEDDDARRLAHALWDIAQDAHTAALAVAIHDQLRHDRDRREAIDVPERMAARVAEAIERPPATKRATP